VAAAGYHALAGLFDTGGPSAEGEARPMLRQAFGPDVTPDLVLEGPLSAARTPQSGGAPHGSPRTLCVLAGRIHNLEEVAAGVGLDPEHGPEQVLADAYERQGPALLEALSGSFVLLFWNRTEGRGLVAQDQLGASSLFYCTAGSRLLFASEVFLLLRMLPRRPAPSSVAIVHMLAHAAPPIELTPYEGVRRATGGHLLEIGGNGWRLRRYWAPRYRPPERRSLSELGEELWTSASRAVRSRIGEGERVGIIMSGGVDSCVVAAAAANGEPTEGRLRGYSAVFPGRLHDESARIEPLVQHLGLPSVQLEVSARGALELGLEYMRRWELPFPTPGLMVEHPLVARAAEDGMTVLFDGQGGDEVFGFSPYLTADRVRQGRLFSSFRLARSFPYGFDPVPTRRIAAVWRRYGLKGAVPYRVHTLARRLHGSERYAPEILTAESARLLFDTDDYWTWKKSPGPRWWAYKAYLTTRRWDEARVPEYARHRAAMAGLEARPPLMDVALIERALAIPPELDFSRRFDRPVMREGLRDRVPDEVRLWRQKSNLAPMYHEAVVADLAPVRRILGSDDSETRAFVRGDAIRDLLVGPTTIGDRHWMRWLGAIWPLLTVECWLRQEADPSYADRMLASGVFQRPAARVHRAPPAET
jgi:asparagine synthase (glutamine-hydrolysing)